MINKTRLDHLLVARELADSGSQAQALILAGAVVVDGRIVDKPGTRVTTDARVEMRERPPYVSRGGLKLAPALDAFRVSVVGAVCADVGASTGGFTDCLLQRGAARVYAIDVGYGQLAWRLRQDSRVVVMERTNARYVERLPEPVGLVTVDASFISLDKLFPALVRWLDASAHVIPLVKPQFEAGREQVGRGGVVRDPEVHRQVLEKMANDAARCGLTVWGVIRSPINGPAGNAEFLMHLRRGDVAGHPDWHELLAQLDAPK
jgi:23S rRNA (cytidine1920-2'-O)/16S rRNA (cytidine1409-2'-O)-methyltransferase